MRLTIDHIQCWAGDHPGTISCRTADGHERWPCLLPLTLLPWPILWIILSISIDSIYPLSGQVYHFLPGDHFQSLVIPGLRLGSWWPCNGWDWRQRLGNPSPSVPSSHDPVLASDWSKLRSVWSYSIHNSRCGMFYCKDKKGKVVYTKGDKITFQESSKDKGKSLSSENLNTRSGWPFPWPFPYIHCFPWPSQVHFLVHKTSALSSTL